MAEASGQGGRLLMMVGRQPRLKLRRLLMMVRWRPWFEAWRMCLFP